MPRVRAQKRVGLYACNCAKCKNKYRYSYSTVCRHRNLYGTVVGEADKEVCAPETRDCLQLNSNLDIDQTDVTISNDLSTCEWEKDYMRLRMGLYKSWLWLCMYMYVHVHVHFWYHMIIATLFMYICMLVV